MDYEELLYSPIFPPEVVTLIRKASQHLFPVLILGEKGTGKELVAKMIHSLSHPKPGRFHRVDCRMLGEEIFEDHLSRILKETRSEGSIPTLFLKEIGLLSLAGQSAILELLEEGLFSWKGEKRGEPVRFRLLASSSENLNEKVDQGEFLEDLCHRFRTITIIIPPLRERTKEIGAIAQAILDDHAKKMKIRKVTVSDQVLRLLQSYWWPENLRELEQILLRSALFSEGDQLLEKDLFFEIGPERNSFGAFLKRSGFTPDGIEKAIFPAREDGSSLPVFFMELVHRIKNPLVSIKAFTQLLPEKFVDAEFRETFYRIVTDDIEKIDMVLNDLLSFVKINTPLSKSNTVNAIVEEVLKKHQAQFEAKRIRVFKKLDEKLPETIVHEEHLKYILDSIVQYAFPSIPPNGSIGLLTKPSTAETERKGLIEKNGRYIEILIAYTGCRKATESLETLLGIPGLGREDPLELELRLAKEIIQKNHGQMKLEVNERKPRTLISLKFPVERRKKVYYPSHF